MKINEMCSKSIKELIDDKLELTYMNVHTEDDGTVRKVEFEYKPKEETDGSTGVDCERDIDLGRDDF